MSSALQNWGEFSTSEHRKILGMIKKKKNWQDFAGKNKNSRTQIPKLYEKIDLEEETCKTSL